MTINYVDNKKICTFIVLGWYYFGKGECWGLVRNVLEMERYIVGWIRGGVWSLEWIPNGWKSGPCSQKNGDKKSGSWCVWVFVCCRLMELKNYVVLLCLSYVVIVKEWNYLFQFHWRILVMVGSTRCSFDDF